MLSKASSKSSLPYKDSFFLCPIKIYVITVVVLGAVTPITVFANDRKNSSILQMQSVAFPSDEVTEPQNSARSQTLTKDLPTGGTTSTVRPWPSHNFFRSVLSKSDNTPAKHKNGSRFRPETETGVHAQTNLYLKGEPSNYEAPVPHKRRHKKYQVNRKRIGIAKSIVSEPFFVVDRNANETNNSMPTSELINFNATILDTPAGSSSQARFSSFPEDTDQLETIRGSTLSAHHYENLTDPTRGVVSGLTGASNNTDDELAYIHNPNFGFQYEIIVPPTLSPSRPKLKFSSALNASSNDKPSSTGMSSVFHLQPEFVHADGERKKNRNTSNLAITAVTENEVKKRVTNENKSPPSQPPLPLKQPEGNKTGQVSGIQDSESFSEKRNEMILPNLQSFSSLAPYTPTQQPQLDTELVKASPESIKQNNKSYLPQSAEQAYLHTEIKRKTPWTINHDFGNASSSFTQGDFPQVPQFPAAQSTNLTKDSSFLKVSKDQLPITTTKLTWAQPTHFPGILHPEKERPISTETSSNILQDTRKTIQRRKSNDQREVKTTNGKHPVVQSQEDKKNQIAILNRRNKFTVVKGVETGPRIHVESGNNTEKKEANTVNIESIKYPSDMHLLDRTNQVEKPVLSTSILAGHDQGIISGPEDSDFKKVNDYFDEDDAQENLHHWIETEQGHFVSPSSELPTFTNLTWPYYIPAADAEPGTIKKAQADTKNIAKFGSTGASTGLSVSFNSQGKEKQNLNAEFEYYIPSASADPYQNPILLAKKPRPDAPNSGTWWTRVTTAEPQSQKQGHLKETDHKSKIKQTHWGSNGLTSVKPQSPDKNGHQSENKIKVYESSTGSPKSTPTSYFPPQVHKPSSSKQGHDSLLGHSETASFVTSKTPTNIWYKPIINHFTATVPFNRNNSSLLSNLDENFFNNPLEFEDDSYKITSFQPPSTRRKGYVGGNDDYTFPIHSNPLNNNTASETFPYDDSKPILFKVWNIVDGSLKLENQRTIPTWALQGFKIPESGTILNLQQIPPALQPLVTSAIASGGSEYQTTSTTTGLQYVWKQLPLGGGFTVPYVSTVISTTFPTTLRTTTALPLTSVHSLHVPNESLHDNNVSNKIKTVPNVINGEGEAGIASSGSASKQPISINYILWNNPASIYGQSIILSTPTPQILLSHHPTPVSYFPSSTITPMNSEQSSVPSTLTVTNPGSTSKYVTTTTPRTTQSNSEQEKLELLFQNYFQYWITSTPAPTTTTTPTPPPENKTEGQHVTKSKEWSDLKKLILRFASTKNEEINKKDTAEHDKSQDLDFLGNVAATVLLMSYLKSNKRDKRPSGIVESTTPAPYGVTDDMTPPNKDQLWATVYPLFQHYLNNPNYTFVPPPQPPLKTNLNNLEHTSLVSMPPTSPGPIPFTEPIGVSGSSSNYFTQNADYNHYASYVPRITTESSYPQVAITQIPHHGQTTAYSHTPRSDEQLDPIGVENVDIERLQNERTKTLLLIKKIKKKKKKIDKLKKKKKDKVKKAFVGAALLKKVSGPLFGVVKKPKKFWLDLQFEIDFLEILRKKLLYFLAYRYMPVAAILAFGLIPVVLSLVPLLYKMWWMKWKKPKYIKVKVPVHIPKPYPVPVYKPPPPPPPYYHRPFRRRPKFPNHPSHFSPPQAGPYANEYHNDDPPIHIDSPPSSQIFLDHHYAADTTGNSNENTRYKYPPPNRETGSAYTPVVNSFNYDPSKHSTMSPYPPNQYSYQYPSEGQEVHVHLHDDDNDGAIVHQHFQPPAASDMAYAPAEYTSYNDKDLQPYPVTKEYEAGFGLGEALGSITNKHDMEIFKILVESKKEKINKLLDIWKLAKYGAAVASEAAVNAIVGPTTPTYPELKGAHTGKKKRKRRRRRKRKQSVENVIHSNTKSAHVSASV